MPRNEKTIAVTPTSGPVYFPSRIKTAPGAKPFALQPGQMLDVPERDPWVRKQLRDRGKAKATLARAKPTAKKAKKAKE